MLAPLRERLALLDGAHTFYDLDEPADLYGNGVVAALEEKVAGLLGKEAAAFFPTGTMAQQVALRCWAGRTGNPTSPCTPWHIRRCTSATRFREVTGLRPSTPTTSRGSPRPTRYAASTSPSAR